MQKSGRWDAGARRSAAPKRTVYAELPSIPSPAPALSSRPVTKKVANVREFPFSTVGRLFFRQNGRPFWGTACIIAKRGIYTAAQNLWDDGAMSTHVEFWLQYEQGHSQGQWVPDQHAIYVPDNWKTQRTATFDYAVFRPDTDLPVAQTGVLQYAPSASLIPGTICTAIGYPGDPFDPEYMWQCLGAIDYTLFFLSQMQNEFTDGTGGGPWVADLTLQTRIIGSMGQVLLPAYTGATSPPFDGMVEAYFQKVQERE